MTRRHTGNIVQTPDFRADCDLVGPTNDWRLLIGKPRHSWLQVRVAAHGIVRGPANFWLLWNGERLASTNHTAALREHQPALEPIIIHNLRRAGRLHWRHLGRICHRWDVDIRDDPDGWDDVRITPDPGGSSDEPILLRWNGVVFQSLEAVRPRVATALEKFMQSGVVKGGDLL